MNESSWLLDAQVVAMLGRLDAETRAQRSSIMDNANRRTTETLREARRQARQNVHDAVAKERKRLEMASVRARANRQTRARQALQRQEARFLSRAWPRLAEHLAELWRAPDWRRIWLDNVVNAAAARLVPGQWELECPVDLEPAERDALGEKLTALATQSVALSVVTEITAGVRVQSGAACLDATPAGLMADRRALEAELLQVLLAEFEHQGGPGLE